MYSQVEDINFISYESVDLEKIVRSFESSTKVGFDTETTGLAYNSKCLLIQMSNNEYNVVFDVNKSNKYFKRILKILTNPAICKVGINLKYDYIVVKTNFNIRLTNMFDCMIAEIVIRNGKKTIAKAEYLVQKYAGVQLNKSIGAEFADLKNGIELRHIKYSLEDTAHLLLIEETQQPKLDIHNQRVVFDHEIRTLPAIAEMEINGFKLNKERWLDLYYENLKELDKLIYELDDEFIKFDSLSNVQLNLFGRKLYIDYDSPAQVTKLFNKVGLKIDSVAKKTLIELKTNKLYGKAVAKYIQYSEKRKEITTYGKNVIDNYLIYPDQRLRTNFWQINDTGRLSSSKPNLQNIPRDNKFRNCFISEEGWSLVSTDYSQQELRILAALSKEESWLEAFKNGVDLHTYMTVKTFGIPESKVKDKFPVNPTFTYRDIQKTINFGIPFGMSAYKLATSVDISKEQAQVIINDYYRNAPNVKKHLEFCSKFAMTNGFIKTAKPFSRVRYLDIEDYKSANKGKNTPIQGTGADMVKLAMCYIHEYIIENKLDHLVKMVMQIHDDIICEVHDSFREEWGQIQVSLLKKAAEYIIDPDIVTFKSDLNISKIWTK
jgi:DNA polymerase-1